MSTEQTLQINSAGAEDTLRLAEEIGSKLRGGELIELVSDLGGGKTTFVKGLALGMGSQDVVSSPSFTIANEYRVRKLTLYHFDFYRLSEPGVIREELSEAIADTNGAVAVEWPEIIEKVLPPNRLLVQITINGETVRRFDFTYPSSLGYLFQ